MVLEGQQTPGVVQSLKGDKVQVAFGQLLTTVDRKRLRVVSNSEYREATRPVTARTVVSVDVAARKLNFKDHIDVRGMRASEAVEAVQNFIDDALMVGVGSVTILHGKGTGALKEEIPPLPAHGAGHRRRRRRTCRPRRRGHYGRHVRERMSRADGMPTAERPYGRLRRTERETEER